MISPAFSCTSPANVTVPLPNIVLNDSISAILTFKIGNQPVIKLVTVGELLCTTNAGLIPAPSAIVITAVVA